MPSSTWLKVMLELYVDADACPVKQEVYKVARRRRMAVYVVSNTWIQIPKDILFRFEKVGIDGDAADDWIVGHIDVDDICITADIPLAARCLECGAHVLSPRGREFTAQSIGDDLATRNLMTSLRDTGYVGTGPPPMTQRDRSQFLNKLDQIIQRIHRERARSGPGEA